jgi:hypothetical protein
MDAGGVLRIPDRRQTDKQKYQERAGNSSKMTNGKLLVLHIYIHI